MHGAADLSQCLEMTDASRKCSKCSAGGSPALGTGFQSERLPTSKSTPQRPQPTGPAMARPVLFSAWKADGLDLQCGMRWASSPVISISWTSPGGESGLRLNCNRRAKNFFQGSPARPSSPRWAIPLYAERTGRTRRQRIAALSRPAAPIHIRCQYRTGRWANRGAKGRYRSLTKSCAARAWTEQAPIWNLKSSSLSAHSRRVLSDMR